MNQHEQAMYAKPANKWSKQEAEYIRLEAHQAAASIRQRYSSKGENFIRAIIVELEDTLPKQQHNQPTDLFGDE